MIYNGEMIASKENTNTIVLYIDLYCNSTFTEQSNIKYKFFFRPWNLLVKNKNAVQVLQNLEPTYPRNYTTCSSELGSH